MIAIRSTARALACGFALMAGAAQAQDSSTTFAPATVCIPVNGTATCDGDRAACYICPHRPKQVRTVDGPVDGPAGPASPGPKDLPPPKPGERVEIVWFVTRVDDKRDSELDGAWLMTKSQAKAYKVRREAELKAEYGAGARIVVADTFAEFACAFMYQSHGSEKLAYSWLTNMTDAQKRAAEIQKYGGRVLDGPYCRP